MKLRIAPPRPSWIDEGSSPMIAPTTLAVAETLSAAKRYGSDAGTFSLPEAPTTARRVRAHQLERARVGRVEAAQRVDRDREEGQVGGDHRDRDPGGEPAASPSQTTTIGAIARIGIVCEATMYGRKPRCSSREWWSTTPIAKPIAAPSSEADAPPPSP